ncbi:hypothetical protein Lesp01_39460 [Lentzea sp. NBRC 102530]|nr:hypothetical protein Lesp01_39460 [Lentzea sp. NBRC 102530]
MSWWRSLGTVRHRTALAVLLVFSAVCLTEELAQASQRYLLGFPEAYSLGLLGHAFPRLAGSAWLDHVCAGVMLAGLVVLRFAFAGRALRWWTAAMAVQLWHHFESRVVPAFPGGMHLAYNVTAFALMAIALDCLRRQGRDERGSW